MIINLKDYLRPNEAMEVVGLKRTSFYALMPWLIERKAVEKRGKSTYILMEALIAYNRMKHEELYG